MLLYEHNKENKMKILVNKKRFASGQFNKPYTTPNKGRSTTTSFASSRVWHKTYGNKIWKVVDKYGPKFVLLWGDPNIAKTHFSFAFGEALPYTGFNLHIVHTKNLQEQTSKVGQHYASQGYTVKQTKVVIIHKLYALLNKIDAGKHLDTDDLELLNFLNKVEFIVLDELHKFTKGIDVKMIIKVLDYLFSKNARLVLGTTATGRNINRIWHWAGSFIKRNLFTFKPTKAELKAEGYRPVGPVIIHADTNTKVFDRDYVESQGIKIDEKDPDFQNALTELTQNGIDDSVPNLVNADHKLKFRNDVIYNIKEELVYQDNRVEVAVKHYMNKAKSEPAIINVRFVSKAVEYAEAFNKKFKGTGIQAIAWNSEGKNNHPDYKNDERKMLDDVIDPKHPLKVIFTNDMLKEGTNESFHITYQCVWSPSESGVERSIQLGNRSKKTVILLDAQNTRHLPTSNTQTILDQLKDKTDEAGLNLTKEQLEEMLIAYQTGKKVEMAKTKPGETPDVEIDFDHLADTITNKDEEESYQTESGETYTTIATEDVWVYSVEHKGKINTLPLDMDDQPQHTTLIESIDELMKGVK